MIAGICGVNYVKRRVMMFIIEEMINRDLHEISLFFQIRTASKSEKIGFVAVFLFNNLIVSLSSFNNKPNVLSQKYKHSVQLNHRIS